MALTRRDFLRRTSLALAGGLIVGDAALEAFERLTHRKVFALGGLPREVRVPLSVSYQPLQLNARYSFTTIETDFTVADGWQVVRRSSWTA